MEHRKSSSDAVPNTKTTATSLPPGPRGLPLVGSMFEYEGPKTNLEWTEKYGPVYYVRMGDKKLAYLNTIELVEKYMEGPNGEQFLDRPTGPAAFGEGLLFGSGDKWKSNKRAFMKALHTKTLLEDIEGAVQTELAIALEDLHSRAAEDQPIKIGDTLLPACANVVAGLLLGESLPKVSPDREILHAIVKNLEGVDLNSPLVQLSLKHPKMIDNLKKFMCQDMIDIYGTSRRLQRLIGQWIHQIRRGLKPMIYHDDNREYPSGLHTPSKPTTRGETPPVLKISPPKFENSENGSEQANQWSGEIPSSEMKNPRSKNTVFGDGNSPRPKNVLQKQNEVEHAIGDNRNLLQTTTNLSRKFISSESLLTLQDESAVEAVVLQVHFAALGFLPGDAGKRLIKPVALPVLPTDTPGRCETTQLAFQRHLGREMSMNEKHDSILQRILAQPEFAQVEEGKDEELLQSLVDMFFGGVTSVVSGLEFVLMYLSKNPTMQMLAQQEIARVLAEETKSRSGESDVNITWSMRDKMPYVRACIVEGLRLGCVTPSSLPHVASVDAQIEEFLIPKSTFVLGSIYSLHRDPKEYTDADAFRPHRHLDDGGNLKLPRSYRPFGIGARRCVGEALAEVELFIFTAAILRNFDLISPPGSKEASAMETHTRIVHRLKDFQCMLHKRK